MIPTCLYSSGADLTEVQNMLRGEAMTGPSKCFIKCIGEKSGLIQNGILHPENLDSVPKLSTLDSNTKRNIRKCLKGFQESRIQSCDDVEIIEKCLRLIPHT